MAGFFSENIDKHRFWKRETAKSQMASDAMVHIKFSKLQHFGSLWHVSTWFKSSAERFHFIQVRLLNLTE